jgi:hypothetical protein
VLWRAVCEGLGYSGNTRPFARLAEACPWSDVALIAATSGQSAVTALLLGAADLMGHAPPEQQACWERLVARHGAAVQLRAAAWSLTTVRPGNHPARRLQGLARLAASWAGRDPLASLADRLLGYLAAASDEPRTLHRAFLQRPWIGDERARTITVNALLPFAAALGRPGADAVYARLPGEAMNRVTRYMAAQLGLTSRQAWSALHRQGLLHLFKTACHSRVCESCPAADRARFALGT